MPPQPGGPQGAGGFSYILIYFGILDGFWAQVGGQVGAKLAMLEHVRPSRLQLDGSRDDLEGHVRKYYKNQRFP